MRHTTLMALFVGVALLAGCGKPVETGKSRGETAAPTGPVTQVNVTFREWSLAVEPATVPSGNVSLKVTNAGQQPHGFYISGPGIDSKGNLLQPAQTEALAKTLETGEYQLIDFVGSNETTHGMTATLTVE